MLSTIDKVLFLKNVEMFARVPGDALAQVAQIAEEVAFERGQELIAEGDMGDCMYLVVDGEATVSVGGRRVASHSKGDCLGEMSLLDAEPRSATVMASSRDLVALRITADDFDELVAEQPDIAEGIITVLVGRLRTASRQ